MPFIAAGGKVANMLGESGMGAIAQSTLVSPVLFLGRLVGAAVGVGAGFLTLQTHTVDEPWSQPFLGAWAAFAVTSVGLACVDAGNKSIYVCYADSPALMAERMPEVEQMFGSDERNKAGQPTTGVHVELVKP